jgi:hypothetical protein
VTDGVNPAVKEVETPDLEAILDSVPLEAERSELAPGHHTVLPSGQFGQFRVGRAALN